MLAFQARYEVEPTFAAPGRIEIILPDGRTMSRDDPDASAIISDFLGHSVRLGNQPHTEEKTGIDRATVFGDVPVHTMKPDWMPESMPDYSQLLAGTFFEIGAVYLLASGSADQLRKLQGGTAQIDRRRFRPNIYIEWEPEWGGFVEPAHALVRDVNARPTRSAARLEYPWTTAQHHRGCLGGYAIVTRSGLLHVGDAAFLVNQETTAEYSMSESA